MRLAPRLPLGKMKPGTPRREDSAMRGCADCGTKRPEACALIVQSAIKGPERPMDVHLCNAYTLALADTCQDYRDV